ncbi:hypothetical protein HDU93_008672, partial [Gonapodya sp. JEL0774]
MSDTRDTERNQKQVLPDAINIERIKRPFSDGHTSTVSSNDSSVVEDKTAPAFKRRRAHNASGEKPLRFQDVEQEMKLILTSIYPKFSGIGVTRGTNSTWKEHIGLYQFPDKAKLANFFNNNLKDSARAASGLPPIDWASLADGECSEDTPHIVASKSSNSTLSPSEKKAFLLFLAGLESHDRCPVKSDYTKFMATLPKGTESRTGNAWKQIFEQTVYQNLNRYASEGDYPGIFEPSNHKQQEVEDGVEHSWCESQRHSVKSDDFDVHSDGTLYGACSACSTRNSIQKRIAYCSDPGQFLRIVLMEAFQRDMRIKAKGIVLEQNKADFWVKLEQDTGLSVPVSVAALTELKKLLCTICMRTMIIGGDAGPDQISLDKDSGYGYGDSRGTLRFLHIGCNLLKSSDGMDKVTQFLDEVRWQYKEGWTAEAPLSGVLALEDVPEKEVAAIRKHHAGVVNQDSDIRNKAKARGLKVIGERTVSAQEVVSLYKTVGGRCVVSGVKVSFQSVVDQFHTA